jgi:hypothetical protein
LSSFALFVASAEKCKTASGRSIRPLASDGVLISSIQNAQRPIHVFIAYFLLFLPLSPPLFLPSAPSQSEIFQIYHREGEGRRREKSFTSSDLISFPSTKERNFRIFGYK